MLLSVILDIIARGNGEVISRGEAECKLAIDFRVQLYPKLHEKACDYLSIIYFIKCSLIFQDSYLRSGDMTTFLGGHLDYDHSRRLCSYVLLIFPLFK